MRRGPDIGQCGPQAFEAGGIVRPQASQQPAGLVIRERVDRRKVEPDPLCHGGQAEVRQACEAVPRRALEGDRGVRHSGSKDRAAGIGPIGVGVVVEEEIEAGRSTEVEQGKRLVPGVLRSNVAETGQQRGATSDLVGLGRTGGDQSLELDRDGRGRSWRRPPRRHPSAAFRPGHPARGGLCRRTRPTDAWSPRAGGSAQPPAEAGGAAGGAELGPAVRAPLRRRPRRGRWRRR